MTFALTQHAVVRTQQRGVPHRLIDALMSYADFEAPVGGGCTVLRMTRDRLDVPDLTDRLGADVMVWTTSTHPGSLMCRR